TGSWEVPAGRRQQDDALMITPIAGADAPLLVDVDQLRRDYWEREPDLADPAQRVMFGTSGHRGSSSRGTFNEAHVLAITQAICDYRYRHQINGPLFIGKDTHALSGPALATALGVLAANDVRVLMDSDDRCTPTPAISHAIVKHNRGRTSRLADG